MTIFPLETEEMVTLSECNLSRVFFSLVFVHICTSFVLDWAPKSEECWPVSFFFFSFFFLYSSILYFTVSNIFFLFSFISSICFNIFVSPYIFGVVELISHLNLALCHIPCMFLINAMITVRLIDTSVTNYFHKVFK